MMTRVFKIGIASLFILLFAAAALNFDANGTSTSNPPMIPAPAPSGLKGGTPPLHTNVFYSTNWSGYAVPSAGVSDVVGSWVVPAVSCPGGTQYSSIWVGIDGFSSNSVEQIGTDSDCRNGSPRYYAWYEMYPDYSHTIPDTTLKVKPGDTINARVQFVGGGKFTLTIQDLSSGSFSITLGLPNGATAKRNSAEWIVEAPSSFSGVLPLANFGTTFLSDSYAKIGGVTGSIASFSNYAKIRMVVSGTQRKAIPSVLAPNGTDFSVKWYRQ